MHENKSRQDDHVLQQLTQNIPRLVLMCGDGVGAGDDSDATVLVDSKDMVATVPHTLLYGAIQRFPMSTHFVKLFLFPSGC